MENPSPIEVGLKAKGIGPKGLKAIERGILEEIFEQITSEELPEELGSAFLMGFRVLENDSSQLLMLEESLKKYSHHLTESLNYVAGNEICEDGDGPRFWIRSLKDGEELNAGICSEIIDYLLNDQGDGVFKAALLQGLRVKRETDRENAALYARLLALAPHRKVAYPSVIDISEPYDGMNRNPYLGLELATLLSLQGEQVVLHGVRGLGPKYGNGPLSRVDEKVACDFELGLRSLDETGVAILDQAHVWPELHHLRDLRNKIRKRPFLATMEKMLMPIRGEETLLVTGYVHSAYRDSIPAMLLECQMKSFLMYKGLEGGVQLRGGGDVSLFSPDFLGEMSKKHKPIGDPASSPWGEGKGLFGTVEAILGFGLGRKGAQSRIENMKAMVVDGRFQEKLNQIREFYPEPCVG